MFIVIEGQDATGKDAQAAKFADYFRAQGKNVVHYAESGTASKNDFVRTIAELNYGSKNDIDKRTRALLYLVNRYEQFKKYAEPALVNNDIVIITRYWFSTYIYEGYGMGVSRTLIKRLHRLIMPEHYFQPDKIVILTQSDENRQKRMALQGKRTQEFFKSQDDIFGKKINNAYLKVVKEFNVPVLDASGTPDEVFANLKKLWSI
ncbi:MAG: dTMP kinase [Candidatus Saccharibacteria bacterium]|nr:dTMP kinase [Candidatus Saccharibacteria bacterium]